MIPWIIVVVLCLAVLVQTVRLNRLDHKLSDLQEEHTQLSEDHIEMTLGRMAAAAAWTQVSEDLQNTLAERNDLESDVEALQEAYRSLEKGADEQQESFEQEYLSWDESKIRFARELEAQAMELERLREIVYAHERNCLPNLATMGDIHG